MGLTWFPPSTSVEWQEEHAEVTATVVKGADPSLQM